MIDNMSKSNFQITDTKTGKEYWISRSVVVCPFTFMFDDNDVIYTLVEKRGPDVSRTGQWCCPCGYLDWDEDFTQACMREVREETGVVISPDDIHFIGFNSDPKSDSRQNVSVRFCCFVPRNTGIDMSKVETKGEVDELKWVPVARFNRKGLYYPGIGVLDFIGPDKDMKFVFGHDRLLREVLEKYYDNIIKGL